MRRPKGPHAAFVLRRTTEMPGKACRPDHSRTMFEGSFVLSAKTGLWGFG